MDVVYFVVLVGALIFVHELGHFSCAKLFDVKVLKFSLGFGPKLAGFRRGETEYVIAAVPLGGYVRMVGENGYDDVAPADRGRALSDQATWKRVIIVIAGPVMNLALPLLLYFLVFLGDTKLPPAVVGTVFPGRPADGHLEPGDRVLAIDGERVDSFYDVRNLVGPRAGEALRFRVRRDGSNFETTIKPVATLRTRPLDLSDYVGRIGITPNRPAAVIGVASPESPAALASLRTFDRIIAVNGRPVETWPELERAAGDHRADFVSLTYLRPVRVEDGLGGAASFEIYEPHVATLAPNPGTGSWLERSGLEPAELYVADVTEGSVEHRFGLRRGDRLLELDGQPIRLWRAFVEDLQSGSTQTHTLSWLRDGRVMTSDYRLRRERGTTEYGQAFDRFVIGVRNWMPVLPEPPVPNANPISYAAAEAFRATSDMVELTIFSVVRLIQGRLSVKSIGGPLTIFDVAGLAAREGPLNYLALMAFLSINLGLLNLLPIPMLDGGHLLFFLLEAVARRPLSVRVREYASIVGLALLLVLMVLAFKNDVERQWPELFRSTPSAGAAEP